MPPLGTQKEASADNVGVEHFLHTWAMWFGSQCGSPKWGQVQGNAMIMKWAAGG